MSLSVGVESPRQSRHGAAVGVVAAVFLATAWTMSTLAPSASAAPDNNSTWRRRAAANP